MKRKFTLAICCFFFAAFTLAAQNYVNRVIIVNEGHYDYATSTQTVPVTVGVYNPATQQYQSVDTIAGARFATNVIVSGTSIYVAADNQLLRYDADSYQRLKAVTVEGIRKLAVWNNQVLVSRGEYLKTFNSYFQAYDKNTLDFIYELPATAGPAYASEGIVVKDNVAYVAVNNGFDWGNEVGRVGQVDLYAQTYGTEIDLGTSGKNPEAIFLDGISIYTVNNTDYSTASISSIDVTSKVVNTTNLNTTTGCGASDYTPGYVLFQVSGDNKVGKFNTSTLTVTDQLLINKSVYGMATDNINNQLYSGETDYTTYGKINIYDLAGTFVSSFDVSVAPGNIAFDVRSSTGISTPDNSLAFYSYPNPAQSEVKVIAENNSGQAATYILRDVTGREVKSFANAGSSFLMDVSTLPSGVYYLQSSLNSSEPLKIVKQ